MSERTALALPDADVSVETVDLDMWTALMSRLGHTSDADRARALKMHHSAISRLRASVEITGSARPTALFVARTVALGIPYWTCFDNTGRA